MLEGESEANRESKACGFPDQQYLENVATAELPGGAIDFVLIEESKSCQWEITFGGYPDMMEQ